MLWRRGDLEQALARFEEAGAYGRQENIRELAATASMNVGLILTELGRYGEALRADQYAAQAYRDLGARERLATIQMNLGLLHLSRGEYGQALEALLESRALCDELGLEPKRAAADLVLARTYQALNLDAEAAETSGQAVETLRRHDLPFELANALLRNGLIAEWRGDLTLARQNLTEARTLFAASATRFGRRWPALPACAWPWPRRPARARRAVGRGCPGVERLGDLGAPDQAAAGDLLQGEIALRLGHLEPARASIQAARDIGQQLERRRRALPGLHGRGILLEADARDEARVAFGGPSSTWSGSGRAPAPTT